MSDALVPLVEVQHHNIALLFANYLQSLNIPSKVTQQNDHFVVFCAHIHLEQGKTLFEEFAQNPHHPKYQQAAWHGSESVDLVASSNAKKQSFKTQFFAHAGVVTLTIFALCWLVFITASLGWQRTVFNALQFYHQLNLTSLFDNPLRLIGPAFFHFSLLHIAFNTMWWWQLGGAIEKVMGKWQLLQLFLLSAIISNLGQFIVSGPNFGGLSGVVYAVVGYVWFAGWLAPEKGLNLSKPIIGFLLFWLLLGFVDLLPIKMANTAHLLGLVSGCGLAWLSFSGKRSA